MDFLIFLFLGVKSRQAQIVHFLLHFSYYLKGTHFSGWIAEFLLEYRQLVFACLLS